MVDFGILLIKPDGVEKKIAYECEFEIMKRNIHIIAKKTYYLSTDDIKTYFYYQIPIYTEYMCSGPVCAYLLSGIDIDIDIELYHIKDTIRKKYNVSGRDLKNLVHGSHCGTEFYIQRQLFFPEYEQYKYTAYADMLVQLPEITDNSISKVSKIIEYSYVKKVCIIVPYDNFNSCAKLIYKKLSVKNVFLVYSLTIKITNYLCKLYCYCPPDYKNSENDVMMEIKENKNLLIALGEIEPINYDLDVVNISTFSSYVKLYDTIIGEKILNIYNELQKQGIKISGLVVNSANMNLIEAETRYEVMQHLGLIYIGGSNNFSKLGLFGISKSKYIDAMKSIQ